MSDPSSPPAQAAKNHPGSAAILPIIGSVVARRFRASLVLLCGLIVSVVLTVIPAYSAPAQDLTGQDNGASVAPPKSIPTATGENTPQLAEMSQPVVAQAETPQTQGEESGARGIPVGKDPIASMDEWRKETFAGKDPVKFWEQYSQAAQAELSKPGADPSDIGAKANALGPDAQRVFEFMRDQIALEPYAGVLRGARGTLVAGAGNALDRALLAQELLKADGIQSRLVEGKLSETQVEKLLAQYLDSNPVPQVLASLAGATDEAELSAQAAEMAAKAGLAEDRVSDLLQHARAQQQEFWANTNEQRAAQFAFLNGQLQRGGVTTSNDGSALYTKLKERLREHYWLQVSEPDGSWSEFDPTFADAQRGTAYGTDPVALSEIPKDKFHQLEFSLVYHTVTDGAPKEEVLLEDTFSSADALFEPLEFRIQPTNVDANALAAMDPAQKIAALRKFERFQGILRAGPNVFGDRSFDLEGKTYDASGRSSDGGSGGASFGGLGGGFGGGSESPPQFVALQVVMRLTGPGREPVSQTRTLLRAEDVKSPTFAPPLIEWQMLLQPQWLSADFVGFRALSQTIATGNALMQASRSGQFGASAKPAATSPVPLLQLALLRQSAAAGILARHADVRALVDEPMLIISGHGLTGIFEQEGQVKGERFIDVIENSIRYVPGNGASPSAAFDAALRQGVADSTIEDSFLRQTQPGTAAESAITIFQQARLEGRQVLLATPRDSDKLRSAGMPETDIDWIHANEAPTTQLALATTADGRDAWWSIRPDGNAILRARGGRGQAMVEHHVDRAQIAGKVLAFLVCGAETALEFHEGPSGWAGEKLVFCMLAAGVSGGALIAGAHTVSWYVLAVEAVEFLGAGIAKNPP